MDAVNSMARDLVRTRHHIGKLIKMKSNVNGLLLKVHTFGTTQRMAEVMGGVAKTLQRMNKSMNLSGLRDLMQDYDNQMGIMDMKGELLDDVLEEGYDDDDEEEEVAQNTTFERWHIFFVLFFYNMVYFWGLKAIKAGGFSVSPPFFPQSCHVSNVAHFYIMKAAVFSFVTPFFFFDSRAGNYTDYRRRGP